MRIIKSLMTNNPCYKAGRKIAVKGLMLHSVGCPQPDASVFIKNWNKATFKSACVHAFIDANNGNVYQTLPWNHRGWHGGGTSNNTHIGVEMCEPSCIKYIGGSSFTCSDWNKARGCVMRTYNSAVELFAYLCQEYNLDPMTNIISHSEGHKLGVATNHADPEHLWKHFGLSMNDFRNAVRAKIEGEGVTSSVENKNPSQTAYKVRINTSALNVRSGAGTSYKITTQVHKNEVYTIVDELNGWGKLKSGAGWISLAYTIRI